MISQINSNQLFLIHFMKDYYNEKFIISPRISYIESGSCQAWSKA